MTLAICKTIPPLTSRRRRANSMTMSTSSWKRTRCRWPTACQRRQRAPPCSGFEKGVAGGEARAEDVDLLLLTKDESFLKIIENTARDGMHYANTLAEADEIIRKRNVGVTIIDAGMIGKRIEQLVEYLRRALPRLVFIVAGRRDDGEMLSRRRCRRRTTIRRLEPQRLPGRTPPAMAAFSAAVRQVSGIP